MARRVSNAVKRDEIAKAIKAEWLRLGHTAEEAVGNGIWTVVEDFAVSLMQQAAEEGHNWSTSKDTPVWHSALSASYDAFMMLQTDYEQEARRKARARHVENDKEKTEGMNQEQLKTFYAILETKNSWGKNEVKTLLLEVIAGIRTIL